MQARVFAEQQGGQVFFNLMDDLMARVKTPADREALGFFLSQSMGIPADLAMQLASMDPEQLQGMRAAASDQNVGQDRLLGFLEERMTAGAGPAAAVAREAGLEAQRVGIGGRVAESVQEIQDAEIALVRQFMPAALRLVTGTMRGAHELVQAYEEGGVAGVLAAVATMMGDLLEGASKVASEAAAGALNAAGDLAAEALGSDNPITQGLRELGRAVQHVAEDPRAQGRGSGQYVDPPPPPPGGSGASTGGGGPGTEPGGLDPLADASGALRRAADGIDRFRRQGSFLDGDLEAVG